MDAHCHYIIQLRLVCQTVAKRRQYMDRIIMDCKKDASVTAANII